MATPSLVLVEDALVELDLLENGRITHPRCCRHDLGRQSRLETSGTMHRYDSRCLWRSSFRLSSDTHTHTSCTGVKLMQGSSAAATGAERYKLAISDGRYWCTAMMATQLNELAKTNQIHNNTIMRLDDYLSNAVQGKKYANLA